MKSFLARIASPAFLLLAGLPVLAFPPAPPHLIHGTVRDALGNPLRAASAEVLLVTSTGVEIRTPTVDGAQPGLNFALLIPMDAGISGEPYRPTALNPRVPFRIRVRIGPASFVPIQMRGDFKLLGRPGGTTRIDLTLGEDADADGLPDEWERILAGQIGKPGDLAAIQGKDDADGDGLSNLDEYLAGTYAFDPADGLALRMLDVRPNESFADFLAIAGRTYEIQASSDLKAWTGVPFAVGDAMPSPRFRCQDSRVERIRIPRTSAGEPAAAFYRVMAR